MKSTAITRKLDELGRVVIPVELFLNLGIEEKDSLEIFTKENNIILRKYDAASVSKMGTQFDSEKQLGVPALGEQKQVALAPFELPIGMEIVTIVSNLPKKISQLSKLNPSAAIDIMQSWGDGKKDVEKLWKEINDFLDAPGNV
ncbi:AbrB/MazE/SpoVT family DNA-binding domain-containing protein [Lysinibacillus xylanilyticus]|uniref:AbrB/MazE/SpoVT family DNA-binding domain-containing protein n=1 Tax=Lysinibacillus xylanilyticus TaxID=582475 RepID=UPI003CFEC471